MNYPSRAALAVAASLAMLLPVAQSALADPSDPTPSQQDVKRAQDEAASKQHDVSSIQAELASANDELNRTGAEAEMASEGYNKAVWQLGEAKEKLRAARHSEKTAAQAVTDQRAKISMMLTQNYRGSVALDRMQAMVTADGPEKLMDRMGAVSGAGASMEHTYDEYTAARTRAAKAKVAARKAEKSAEGLTADARTARDQAAAVMQQAQSRNDAIAARQSELMDQLATAQGVSRRLAAQRQDALERQAEAARQAAAERQAEAQARAQAQRAAEKAAREAQAKAEAQREAQAKAAADKAAQEKAERAAREAAAKAQAARTAREKAEQDAKAQAAREAAAKAKAAREKAEQDAADEQAQKVADEAARQQSSHSSSSSSSSGKTSTKSSGTSSKGAAAVIAFAKAQLGEPYLWAAAGPSRWDCSGLTMMAWRQAGVSLPHYSAAQYAESKHIYRSQLQPGDLVFWGSSPSRIHHVALYIGNGQILHAPRTGKDVEIDSIDYWIPPNYFARPGA